MDALIILIIIGAFISNIAGTNKAVKQKGKKQSVPNQRRQQDRPMPRTTQRSSQTKRDAAYYYQQQKSTKERLQQKYGLQNKTVQKSDILSKAKENVRENEADMIQQQVHAEVCRKYRDADYKKTDVEIHKMQSENCDTAEESDTLEKVNDLIVMGYDGDMHFDRDFIAEGVDLLNRYSL